MQPFTSPEDQTFRQRARAFASTIGPGEDADPVGLVRQLGDAQLLLPGLRADGEGAPAALRMVILREELAAVSGLADALAAVQALAALPLATGAVASTRQRWLPGLIAGSELGAFALTEPDAGSDLAALATSARRDGDGYRLDGEKCLISNAGIATVLIVFARTGGAGDARPLSAFVVPGDAPGLSVQPTALAVAHPIGSLRLNGVRVGADARLGAEGDGLRLALATLGLMRPTVGAAACGLSRRALDEACAFVRRRQIAGRPLAERDGVQMALGEMATSLEAARLLVYRAAWLRDGAGADGPRFSSESSMAKLFATEAAQQIVDRAVQLHGGQGVVRGVPVERLYREVRALRIYEGTSEIQKLVIAGELLRR